MAKYVVTAGAHVQEDKSKPLDKKGRRPLKQYGLNEVVESDVNLVERFPGKFRLAHPHEGGSATAETSPDPDKKESDKRETAGAKK